MSRQKLTVVISQAQGKNPVKRALEESLAAALLMEPGLDLSIVPYLYDLAPITRAGSSWNRSLATSRF